MSDTTTRSFQRATEESPFVRRALIAAALMLLAILLFAPLAVVFTEALRRGAGAALDALAQPDTWSAVRLTLTVAAIAVPLNAVFGLAAAWTITFCESSRPT